MPEIEKPLWRTKLESFYDDLRSKFPVTRTGGTDNITVIAVLHMVPNSIELARSLREIAPSMLVIPKSSFINQEALAEFQAGFLMPDLKGLKKTRRFAAQMAEEGEEFSFKQAMKQEELAKEILNKYVPKGNKIIVLDIGGYFAPCLSELTGPDSEYKDRFIGISEGTMNGELKYRGVVQSSNVPIISRASDKTKLPENYYVGPDCVRAVDALLIRLNDAPLSSDYTVGLIGFGHVGEPLGRHLKGMGLKVLVHDINPFALINAKANKCDVTRDKDVLLRSCKMIFLATGNKSITLEDLGKVEDGTYFANVTSIDDEMVKHKKLRKLPSRNIMLDKEVINTIYDIEGKKINMLMGGMSVNFYMGTGVANPVLYLALGSWNGHLPYLLNNEENLQAEIRAGSLLAAGSQHNSIKEIPDPVQVIVAETWLDHFGNMEIDGHGQLKTDRRSGVGKRKLGGGRG